MIPQIEQGQKLKDGDYTETLTKIQFDELISIENDSCVLEYEEVGLVAFVPEHCHDVILTTADYPEANLKTEYSFKSFKQLCENTFSDGNV